MTDERLTDELVRLVLGWRPAPDRYLTAARCWIRRSRFRPFASFDDASVLLNRTRSVYVLERDINGVFTAKVQIGDRIGRASGKAEASVITRALVRALAIDSEVSS